MTTGTCFDDRPTDRPTDQSINQIYLLPVITFLQKSELYYGAGALNKPFWALQGEPLLQS